MNPKPVIVIETNRTLWFPSANKARGYLHVNRSVFFSALKGDGRIGMTDIYVDYACCTRLIDKEDYYEEEM